MDDKQLEIEIGFQIMGLAYAITGIVGLVANVLVLQTFWRERRKSLLHIQLALVNIFSLSIIIFIGPAALRGNFFFGEGICQYTGFHSFLFGFSEINFTCLVCLECLVAIMKKSEYKSWMSDKSLTIISVASWVYSLVFSAVPLYGIGRYTYESEGTSCGIDLNRWNPEEVTYLLIATVLFGIMITAAIVGVGVARWKQQDSSYSQTFDPLITDVELVKISTALLAILAVCSLPFALRVGMYIRGSLQPFNSYMGVEFSHLAMKLSCCLHPMVYFVFSEEFQKKAKSMVTGIDQEKKNH